MFDLILLPKASIILLGLLALIKVVCCKIDYGLFLGVDSFDDGRSVHSVLSADGLLLCAI